MSEMKRLKLKKGQYHGRAAIIVDPKINEEYIVMARDDGALQRVTARITIGLKLSSKQNKDVIIIPGDATA